MDTDEFGESRALRDLAGERTRPHVLVMAPRHHELFLRRRLELAARAPQNSTRGACASQAKSYVATIVAQPEIIGRLQLQFFS